MMTNGPLAGIRIIEMDAIGPVPMAGMLLSGLGAEVVRVGRPGGQPAWSDVGEVILHRGRTHISLDLKNPEDKERLLQLVGKADVLLEGLRPGVMERLGLGPDECLAQNPRLVYGRVTGWGQSGPLAQQVGHDINYIAMTGAFYAIGAKNGVPVLPLNLVGDYAGGTMFLVVGVLSALLSARSTGKGQVVDAAMVDGVFNLLSMFHAYLSTGMWKDQRESNLLDGGVPYYRAYACKDGGHVAVGSIEPPFFAQLIAGLGIPADRYKQTDEACWPAMEAEFTRLFLTRTRDEWEIQFAGTDACVSPILSMVEAMTHPVNVARAAFLNAGGVPQAAPAPRFSETPGVVQESETLTAQDVLARWGG
jgi:alpha-methylacyl-CoA racemase